VGERFERTSREPPQPPPRAEREERPERDVGHGCGTNKRAPTQPTVKHTTYRRGGSNIPSTATTDATTPNGAPTVNCGTGDRTKGESTATISTVGATTSTAKHATVGPPASRSGSIVHPVFA
jgi:hypothetical protein